MKKGFYTALGTPLNEDFTFCKEGMCAQIEQQIEAGASGLLVMGSMGNMTYLRDSEYPKVAKCAAEAAKGRIPVLVGVTDVSIGRVMDRVKALEGIRGIDEFDIAYKYGIDYNLDGMFAATPKNAKKMYEALAKGDMETASATLDKILALRDLYVSTGCLMSAFTHTMNLLGCKGIFGRDYESDISDEMKDKVTAALRAMGEI